jgi:hypothetical protein
MANGSGPPNLGGILDDWATGVALDSAGNVLVTGYTRSANFPLANAIQGTLNQGTLNHGATDDCDAFRAQRRELSARHRSRIVGDDSGH